jgi:hypothetical protein
VVVVPLHTITTSGKSVKWGNNQHKYFDEIKTKYHSSTNPCISYLVESFELDLDASGYDMGVLLMKGDNPICYYFDMFHGGVLNYPTYDKELYALVQVVKKWKNYLMGNETIIHTNHQSL